MPALLLVSVVLLFVVLPMPPVLVNVKVMVSETLLPVLLLAPVVLVVV